MTSKQQQMIALLNTFEELDPELADWVVTGGPFGESIKHPLVFSIVHSPMHNAMVNAQLRYKREALAKAEDEENWVSYIYLHERPYRFQALEDIVFHLDPKTYWKLVGSVWTDSENIWQNYDGWRELLSDDAPFREYMMSDEDRDDFEQNFPETMTVYRGYTDEGMRNGMSWTIREDKAEWFADRFSHKGSGHVAKGTVRKSDVLAYHNGRNEFEVVVLPENVKRA